MTEVDLEIMDEEIMDEEIMDGEIMDAEIMDAESAKYLLGINTESTKLSAYEVVQKNYQDSVTITYNELLGYMVKTSLNGLDHDIKITIELDTYNIYEKPLQQIAYRITGMSNQSINKLCEKLTNDNFTVEKITTEEQTTTGFIIKNTWKN